MNKTVLWIVLGLLGAVVLAGGGFVVYQLIDDEQTRKRSLKYKDYLDKVNTRYGLPAGLLYWIAYQESRYRDDIITGHTLSPVGALGMFQLMKPTAADLQVDPLNWQQAADGAARYLLQLNRRYKGSWPLAIAAYNHGLGNVDHKLAAAKGNAGQAIKAMPKETEDYVATVTRGIGVANPAAALA